MPESIVDDHDTSQRRAQAKAREDTNLPASQKGPSELGEVSPPSPTVRMEIVLCDLRKRFFILQSQVETIRNFMKDLEYPIANKDEVLRFYYVQIIEDWLIAAAGYDDPDVVDVSNECLKAFGSAIKLKANDQQFRTYCDDIRRTFLKNLSNICASKLTEYRVI